MAKKDDTVQRKGERAQAHEEQAPFYEKFTGAAKKIRSDKKRRDITDGGSRRTARGAASTARSPDYDTPQYNNGGARRTAHGSTATSRSSDYNTPQHGSDSHTRRAAHDPTYSAHSQTYSNPHHNTDSDSQQPAHGASFTAHSSSYDDTRNGSAQKRTDNTAREQHTLKASAALVSVTPLFDADHIPADARDVLEHFDTIIQGVRHLNGKQLYELPDDIRALSHELTDERSARRVGYMNDAAQLSAYAHYFLWWNLVRLTRLFANIGGSSFALNDGDICLDIGSGPLTVVTALWLARPELRAKKLTWYCMDISQGALALGQDIYFSVAAHAPASITANEADTSAHWNIIRVKGPLGTPVRQKASLITCANMFNELCQNNADDTPEFLAKKYSTQIMAYAAEKSCVFIGEPGVPKSARFISLMRDTFLRREMTVASPCPHEGTCPMNGQHAHRGGTTKWCNLAFSTENAPAALLKLSAQAEIPKERAVLSYIVAKERRNEEKGKVGSKDEGESIKSEKGASGGKEFSCGETLMLRIGSDPIRIGAHIGYYACCAIGLTLVINETKTELHSGDLITIKLYCNTCSLSVDEKTGAREIIIR